MNAKALALIQASIKSAAVITGIILSSVALATEDHNLTIT